MASKRITHYKIVKDRRRRSRLQIFFAEGESAVLDHLYEKELHYIASFLRDQKPVSYDSGSKKFITDKLVPAGEGEQGYPQRPYPLEFWLTVRPDIMDAINWEEGLNSWINYKDWTTQQRKDLEAKFNALYNNEMLDLPALVIPARTVLVA